MRLHWLLPTRKGISVLMYHRVWPGMGDGLTITPEKLKEQWTFLRNEGYHILSLNDFIQIIQGTEMALPKSVLLTFDDGYRNNLTYVYPLLKEFNWTATFLIVANTLNGEATEEVDSVKQQMTPEELLSIDTSVVQFGLHGYHHEDFGKLQLAEMKRVTEQSIQAFQNRGLSFYKVFAYPYGARPKNKAVFGEFKNWMKSIGMEAAFRIGNKVNELPIKDVFEVERIDIKGTDNMEDFKIKLKKGKLKPF
ncbi:MAG TPA: polysaccharide deacetylase family protein [Flavipsychrobacter sp.]|nr:polysaccharide deacetylase family protein [Flavipsychrobacter sp.]